jgi:hypothetical protein
MDQNHLFASFGHSTYLTQNCLASEENWYNNNGRYREQNQNFWPYKMENWPETMN